MSAKLRKAVFLIVTEGSTQRDAAQQAGMHEKSLSRALRRPEIAQHVESLKALAALEAEKLKGIAKNLAIQKGIELLKTAKSEAVRARMVEFFAAEPKAGPQINVGVQVNSGGYEYVPPGARVVEIEATDVSDEGVESAEVSTPDEERKEDNGLDGETP